MRKSSKGNYSKLGPAETLVNERYALTINHEEKMVFFQKAPEELVISPLEIPLDTVLLMCESYRFEKHKGKPSYMIIIKSELAGSFDKMRIVFNPESYLIEQLVLFPLVGPDNSDENPRLEIDFSYLDTRGSSETDFSENRFIRQKGGSWELAPNFRDYRLMNLLEPTN